MCRMCEGFSLEDDLALSAASLAEYGFLTIGIDEPDDPGSPNWTYTVGLLDTYGHPELVVAGPPVVSAHALIHQVWHQIDEGRRFSPGDRWRFEIGIVDFGSVDPVQYDLVTFNRWHLLADHGYLHTPLEAIQVFVPALWKDVPSIWVEPDLSDPSARVDAWRPNRAARRNRRR